MSEYPTKVLEARYTEKYCLDMFLAYVSMLAACNKPGNDMGLVQSLLKAQDYWRKHLEEATAYREYVDGCSNG